MKDINATNHPMEAKFTVFAHCSMTGKFEGAFESMEDLRKVWPGAEIVCTEEHDGYTVVYC